MKTLTGALEHPTGILLGDGWEQRNDDLEVVSPYTGDVVAHVAMASVADVGRAVAAACGHLPPPLPARRAAVLERAAARVAEQNDRLATLIAVEAGKPITQARVEAARCADTLTFAAVEARRLAGQVVPLEGSESGAGKLAFTLAEPVGVVAAIAPFNFPLNLVAHKLAPAIAAGMPGGAQARRGDTAVGPRARRDPAASGARAGGPDGAERTRQHDRRRPRRPPRRRDDLVHRERRGRLGARRAPPAQARRPRARQRHPGDRDGRRRHRPCRRADRRLGLHPRGTVLRLGAARDRRATRSTTASSPRSSRASSGSSSATRSTRRPTSVHSSAPTPAIGSSHGSARRSQAGPRSPPAATFATACSPPPS